jgi:hypothetical protein
MAPGKIWASVAESLHIALENILPHFSLSSPPNQDLMRDCSNTARHSFSRNATPE